MKTVFREKRRQIVARHPPTDRRKVASNRVGIFLLQRFQPRIYFGRSSAGVEDLLELLIARRTDREPCPVVEKDLKLLDVVRRLAGSQRMDATGIVSDHPA